ncbi:ras association domain-containing protein 8-like isoform X2 [Leptotrombidium deliense]|uniref:Ras association domain-containing protein 8-like isoform X2 n=1 Tax=Leptotrombidium deliense TaxID=299467 RepID=A0A443SDP9_9ACAR|nr:ras association domain-containing protein 8-like isoform X2 [Leptotrombidium deliense]
MELKVMVDGIQRVISGVTVETTCKDIVLCLAQANKQFGKFILIEKWRNNERLLSPNDHPIEVLNKLGEYANDVQFIMKRSESLSSYRPPSNQTSQSACILESEGKYNNLVAFRRSGKKCSALNSAMEYSDDSSPVNHHSPKDNGNEVHTASQLSFDCGNNNVLQARPKHPPPYDEAVAKSSLMSPKSPPISGQVKASQALPQSISQRSDGQSQASHGIAITNNKRRMQGTYSSSPSSYSQKAKINVETVSNEHQKLSPNKVNRNMVEKCVRNNQRDINVMDDERHRDAIKLINLQKETMASQKQELFDLESELSYWDNKMKMEDEKLMEIEEELRHLERVWIEQEAQLTKWEQQRILDQIEELQRKNEFIESEKNSLKSQINENDSHIANCRQTIQALMEQLKGEYLQKLKDEEHSRKERDEYEKRLIAELRQELRDKCNETDLLNEDLNQIKNEFRALDDLFRDKRKTHDDLMNEIKNANLEGLSLMPREDTLSHNGNLSFVESSSCPVNDRFLQRPGSTRRMYGSPRQLENAVATNKNPHGVWV